MISIHRIAALTVIVALLLVLAACGDDPGSDVVSSLGGELGYLDLEDGTHADHQAVSAVVLYDLEDVRRIFSESGMARFDRDVPYRQVGWMMAAAPDVEMSFRSLSKDGNWSSWKPVDIFWSEDRLHNGRIILDEPVTTIEITGGQFLEYAEFEFSQNVTARVGDERSEMVRKSFEPTTIHQAVIADGTVTTRHEWDAIDPDKVCGNVVAPYRASIHHTYSPDGDWGDAAARMRQMQDFHINGRGWCDIGYHFVVAQSGEIFQGRSRSDRPGAHVGDENSGNVGISMIGDYRSIHPPQIQLDGVVKMVRWVHETHGVALDRDAIRGHGEWPGQSTDCPGEAALSHIDDIITAAGDGEIKPPGEYRVDISLLIHGLDDFYTQGTSNTVADAFAGDEFVAEIRISNYSPEPIRDVEVAYGIDDLGLRATNYRIESDAPALDQESWNINDSDSAPENPARDQLDDTGILSLYAFAPGETKRIVVDMEATQYNIGYGDFAGIRAWVHNIRDVYQVQESFGEEPDTNVIGELLQTSTRIDVLSKSGWQFRGGQPDDREGWNGVGNYRELAVNTDNDLLAQKIDGPNAGLLAPEWTEVDAGQFDQMVLRVRSHGGDHIKAVYWERSGEEFHGDRRVGFEAAGDGEYQTLVIPIGEHPKWTGIIDGLRIAHLDGNTPSEHDSGWYDIDYIYFQSSDGHSVSSDHLDRIDIEPVDIDVERVEDFAFSGAFPGFEGDESGQVRIGSGCVAVQGKKAPSLSLMIAIFLLGAVFARKRDSARKRHSAY